MSYYTLHLKFSPEGFLVDFAVYEGWSKLNDLFRTKANYAIESIQDLNFRLGIQSEVLPFSFSHFLPYFKGYENKSNSNFDQWPKLYIDLRLTQPKIQILNELYYAWTKGNLRLPFVYCYLVFYIAYDLYFVNNNQQSHDLLIMYVYWIASNWLA